MIPELVTPTYLEMRDRITADGRHWVGEEMRQFLSQKLSDNNEHLSAEGKRRAMRKNRIKELTYPFRRLTYLIVNGQWSALKKNY